MLSFVKGDRGATCEAPPLSPLTIPQTPSRFLNVRCTCICHSPQRMRQRYAYGSNIAAVRCGWEDRIMSNGESQIVESKAALCCGFAIALRALFLVIRRCDFSRTPFVIASEPVGRAWQSTVCEARIMKDSMPFDCFGSASQ